MSLRRSEERMTPAISSARTGITVGTKSSAAADESADRSDIQTTAATTDSNKAIDTASLAVPRPGIDASRDVETTTHRVAQMFRATQRKLRGTNQLKPRLIVHCLTQSLDNGHAAQRFGPSRIRAFAGPTASSRRAAPALTTLRRPRRMPAA